MRSIRRLHPLATFVPLWTAALLLCAPALAQEPLFRQLCAGCHGDEATGGDRAPRLVNSRALRARGENQICGLIHNGTPGGKPGVRPSHARTAEQGRWGASLE